MEYALIAPVNDLDLTEHQKYHMILAWACKNETYLQFYKQQREKTHRFLILDNGANEGNLVEGDEYTELANNLAVDEIIAPDVYNNCDATIEKTTKFLEKDKHKLRDSRIQIMAVPQGASQEEYMRCWNTFLEDYRISTIGIGYRCVLDCVLDDMRELSDEQWTDFSGLKWNFESFREKLKDKDFYLTMSRLFFISRINLPALAAKYNKKFHLLGLWNPYELSILGSGLNKQEQNALRSCDSAAPCQAAQVYTEFQPCLGLRTKPKAMLNMFETLGKGQREMAERNMKQIIAWTNWEGVEAQYVTTPLKNPMNLSEYVVDV